MKRLIILALLVIIAVNIVGCFYSGPPPTYEPVQDVIIDTQEQAEQGNEVVVDGLEEISSDLDELEEIVE